MRFAIMLVMFVALSCGGSEDHDKPADPMTQRQRDSVIGASNLPGAGGVQKALEAADTAAARRARLDSMRQ
jgi:hypothetical protein